jgi:hypothetical protein
MNYSPQNEQSLLDLIGALKGGMDPTTAYGLYQDVQGDQAQRIANRQERLGGLAELLTGAASSGMPLAGAQSLAAAQPGPAGPAVQNMLSSLYPTGDYQAPTGAGGQALDFPTGSRMDYTPAPGSQATGGGGTYTPVPGTPQALGTGPSAMSPVYQPPQPSPTEALAMNEAQQQADMAPLWQEFVANAQSYAMEGKPKEQFLVDAAKAYPELFAGDIQQVQQIVLTIFAQPTAPVG